MNHDSLRSTVFLAGLLAASSALAEGTPPPGASSTVPPAPAAAPTATPPGMSTSTPRMVGVQDDTPIVIVVPSWYANDPNLNNGCWARLYDKNDFTGTVFPLVGPVNIPNNRAGFITGFEMGRNYDSVMLGSRATLTVWEGNDYKNRSTTFGPGQSIPDLDKRMGATEEIRSMKLACSQ